MNRFASIFVAVGLATAGSTALAKEAKELSGAPPKPQPMLMTDAQMDNVAAGLINVLLIDTVDVENVRVNVPVQADVIANVNAAVAVLSDQVSAGQTLGNQTQSNRIVR
jgi:hypothetical protein